MILEESDVKPGVVQEFKQEAVKPVAERGDSVAQAIREVVLVQRRQEKAGQLAALISDLRTKLKREPGPKAA